MTKVKVDEIIGCKVADDDSKGNKVFNEIKKVSQETDEDIIVDFQNIELVNTAFLNNAIGQLFNKEIYDLPNHSVKISNMKTSMVDLLREVVSVANEKYS